MSAAAKVRTRIDHATRHVVATEFGQLLAKPARRVATLADNAAWERKQTEYHRGLPIPPRMLRGHLCGDAVLSNDFYLQSAVVEATRLSARLGYVPGRRVLDVGCGLGRLATGMLTYFGEDADYLGVDPNREFLQWCQEYIQRDHPSFRFEHLDVANALYNPEGTVDGDAITLPVGDHSVDIVYVWGVLTNIDPAQVPRYVEEFARVVAPGGRVFLTAFIERDVPQASVNPDHYVPFDCIVPLHVVRFDEEWLLGLFAGVGLTVEDLRWHGGMFPMQSEITLRALP